MGKKRIKYQGHLYIQAEPPPGMGTTTPAARPGGGSGSRQKALQPAVQRVMPSNPDPLFAKAVKRLEEIEKVLEQANPANQDLEDRLDLRLLIKRYQMPSLQLLLMEYENFHAKFAARIKRARQEITEARGATDEI